MDITNKKTIRILQYALHTLLSNWDEDSEDDLESEFISEEDVKKLTNWIDNKIEESRM
jgi:hypothetical protein